MSLHLSHICLHSTNKQSQLWADVYFETDSATLQKGRECLSPFLLQAISLMSAHGGTVECHCLVQVIRGAESVALPYGNDIHNVLRQHRAQCSTTSKPAPETPGTDSECSNFSPVLMEAFVAATAADKFHMISTAAHVGCCMIGPCVMQQHCRTDHFAAA